MVIGEIGGGYETKEFVRDVERGENDFESVKG